MHIKIIKILSITYTITVVEFESNNKIIILFTVMVLKASHIHPCTVVDKFLVYTEKHNIIRISRDWDDVSENLKSTIRFRKYALRLSITRCNIIHY